MVRLLVGLFGGFFMILALLRVPSQPQHLGPASGVNEAKLVAASKAAHRAADKFLALAKGSEVSGVVPRETDPQVKALLDAVFDTSMLRQQRLLPRSSQLAPAGDWIMSVTRVGQIYALAGTGLTDERALAYEPNASKQVAKNMVVYAPEFGRYVDALLVILAADVSAFPREIGGSTLAPALVKVRSGVGGALDGALRILANPGLSDDWRRARMPGLLALAPEAARLLTAADRSALRELAILVVGHMTDAGVKASLARFADIVGPETPR